MASTDPRQRSGPLTGQTSMHTLPLFSSPLAPWDATRQPDAHGRAAGGTTRSPALRSSLPDATRPATVNDGPLQEAPADPAGTATTGHPEERVRGWHPLAPGQTPAAGWRGLVWDCWVPVAIHHKNPQLPTLLLPGRELARFACRLPQLAPWAVGNLPGLRAGVFCYDGGVGMGAEITQLAASSCSDLYASN